MKKIQLNGEDYFTNISSIVKLLEELNLSISSVLVEQNGIALHRHELKEALLAENDQIEILQIAAGG